MTTELRGRQEAAKRFAAVLNAGGLMPRRVTVLGRYVHATFMGPEPAHRCAMMFAQASYEKPRVVESDEYHVEDKGTRLSPSRYKVWVATAMVPA